MPLVSNVEWNNFLKNYPNAHVLQMAEWGELKSYFGWDVLRVISGAEGIQLLFRKLPFGFTIAYAARPVSGSHFQKMSAELRAEIDAVCRKKHAVFLKIEPDAWDSEPNALDPSEWMLRTSPHNIQPPRTIIVSLEGSEDDILARMKQKCRYNIRLAEKKGIHIRAWDDLSGFYQLMQVTGGRDGFGVHAQEYYRRAYELFHPVGKAELLLAEFEGKPLAALMIFASGARSWYLYGASNDEERNRMPTYLLQWQAIKWAKDRGCLDYDLWGVPDEDEPVLEAQFETRHDGLWGVYRFKRGFGGQVRRAAQALDRVYMPWLYRLYSWRMRKDI
ncbi:MAG: peptidoglycan bridge formation glycyltransferase FemA/FemB family protein [Chloroflexi bacterium]|nr:peptidoglycan bridge formation glycyltransferase FemA/FemB family protein [Chloroflexota bacterium]